MVQHPKKNKLCRTAALHPPNWPWGPLFKMPPMGPSQDKPHQLTIVAQRWWWILLVYGYLAILPGSCAFFWKMGTWRLNSCSATLRETCSCKLKGSTYWTTASAHQVEGRTSILATRFAALVSSTVWSDGHDTLTAAANSQSLKTKMAATAALWSSGHCWWKAFVRPIRRSGWTSTSLQTSFEQLALSQWFLAMRKAECCEELAFWRIGRSWRVHSSNSPILYQCMSESLICMRIVARMAHTRLIGSQITIVVFSLSSPSLLLSSSSSSPSWTTIMNHRRCHHHKIIIFFCLIFAFLFVLLHHHQVSSCAIAVDHSLPMVDRFWIILACSEFRLFSRFLEFQLHFNRHDLGSMFCKNASTNSTRLGIWDWSGPLSHPFSILS